MRVGGRGAWVLVVAAVLGIVGGLTTAFLTTTTTTPGPSAILGSADPLGLDVPYENLQCTGESILVVGLGTTDGALSGIVADHRDEDVRYLNTLDSCPTIYGSRVGKASYVAYLGPYADLSTPCRERLTPAHRGDFVTRLREGNEIHVQCVCVLPVETFPELRAGIDVDANVVWVRALQGLLHDRDPLAFPTAAVTGLYDERTAARVRTVQAEAPMDVTGVVDAATWGYLKDKICRNYRF